VAQLKVGQFGLCKLDQNITVTADISYFFSTVPFSVYCSTGFSLDICYYRICTLGYGSRLVNNVPSTV
jgi:hypothetical protein